MEDDGRVGGQAALGQAITGAVQDDETSVSIGDFVIHRRHRIFVCHIRSDGRLWV